MGGSLWGVFGIVSGALVTAFFSWLLARGVNRRSTIATNAEQDRLRVLDIMEQLRKENTRLIKRAERSETLADHLQAELDFAHGEIRRLSGGTA